MRRSWIVLLFAGTALAQPAAQFINPSTLLQNPRYTQVIKMPDGQIIVSGQVGQKVDGSLVSADFDAQATQALENVRLALQAAGATPGDIVKINTFIVDLSSHIAAYREVRAKFLAGITKMPASTTIGVSSLVLPGALIEIEVTAYKPPKYFKAHGR